MEIPKPTEADKERFRAVVPSDPRIEVKPMFGNLGAFVNGNMFTMKEPDGSNVEMCRHPAHFALGASGKTVHVQNRG